LRPSDGFDAQETSCNLNKIERQGVAWLVKLNGPSQASRFARDLMVQEVAFAKLQALGRAT
jgi:hypothetical protein